MKSKKLVIAVDFDNTIVASSKAVFELYQKESGDYNSIYTDNHLWDFDRLIPSEYWSRAYKYFCEQKFYDILEPLDGAIKVLKELSEEHEVVIVTKHDPDGIAIKAQWIRNNLPFISRVVFLVQDDYEKSIINSDIFIDDKPECLSGSNGFKILFGNYGYNAGLDSALLRAESWNEVSIICNLLSRDFGN